VVFTEPTEKVWPLAGVEAAVSTLVEMLNELFA
jgi:hypothetical protein